MRTNGGGDFARFKQAQTLHFGPGNSKLADILVQKIHDQLTRVSASCILCHEYQNTLIFYIAHANLSFNLWS